MEDNAANEKSELLNPKSRMIKKTDLILVLLMQLLFLTSICVYSSIGPIYTLEATKKGSSTTLTLFFPIFPFDPPENIRKPKVF